jgi:hypothetical protein
VDLLSAGPTLDPTRTAVLRAHGIPVIECNSATAAALKDGTLHLVPDDGHPDAAVHAWWARCIADGIDRLGMGRFG